MKKLFIFVLLVMCAGCSQTVYVTNKDVPILIEQSGCFVTSDQFLELTKGSTVEYQNNQVGKYYLSPKIIERLGDVVRLQKTVSNK